MALQSSIDSKNEKNLFPNKAKDFIDSAVQQFKDDSKLGPRYKQIQGYFDKYGTEWLKL